MLQEEKLKAVSDYLTNYYHNGAIIKLSWRSVYYNVKDHTVMKYTEAYKRLGVDYKNIKNVDNKHTGLKGDQEWEGRYFIKNNKTGEIKLRISNLQNMNNFKSNSYYVDEKGNKYSKAGEIDYLPKSKKHPVYNRDIVAFDVKLDNLLEVGELRF